MPRNLLCLFIVLLLTLPRVVIALDDNIYFDTSTGIMDHLDGIDGGTSSLNSAQSASGSSAGLGLGNLDTAQVKFGSTSMTCNGGTPVVWAHSTVNCDPLIGWDTFTIDFQIRFASVTTAGLIGVVTDASNYWSLGYDAGTSTLEFDYQLAGVSEILISNAWTPSINTWYHIALVRNSSDWYMFIGGGQIGSTATDSSAITDTGAGGVRFGTGRVNDATTSAIDGWIDEVRITRTALWTANFTEPTAAYITDGKRVL